MRVTEIHWVEKWKEGWFEYKGYTVDLEQVDTGIWDYNISLGDERVGGSGGLWSYADAVIDATHEINEGLARDVAG